MLNAVAPVDMSQVIISNEGEILVNRRKLKPTHERFISGEGTARFKGCKDAIWYSGNNGMLGAYTAVDYLCDGLNE